MPALSAIIRLARQRPLEPDAGLLQRFAETGDQDSFAVLVEKHGPIVRGICRRVLRDSHLADDAFQAVFLVLAKKAANLRLDGSLASWLFGVARRVALSARRREDRHNRLRFRARDIQPEPSPDWNDLLLQLDEELTRLPEKLRAPLLACYLHGRTQDEAARELGWSLSTVRRRLERGRELLRFRMTARGATLSAGLFATALAESAVSHEVLHSTLAVVTAAHSGLTIPNMISELAKEATPMSAFAKLGIGAIVTTLAVAIVGLGVAGISTEEPKEKPRDEKPPAETKRDRFNDPLPPHAIARMGTMGFRQSGSCDGLFYAREGKLIVSLGDGRMHVWDSRTGREFGKKGDDNETILAAATVNGGSQLVLYGYRTETGQKNESFGSILDMESLRDTRKFIAKPQESGGRFPRAFAPTGKAMAEVRLDGTVELWDGDGNPTHILNNAVPRTTNMPKFVAFTPDGKSLVSTDEKQMIRVWDVSTGKLIRKFGGDLWLPESFVLSTDGKLVATVSMRRVEGAQLAGAHVPAKIRIWDVTNGTLVREIDWGEETYEPRAMDLSFSPDGKSIVALVDRTQEGGNETRHYRISDGGLIRKFAIPACVPNSIAIHPDGRTLALGTFFGTIRLFDLDTGKETTPSDLHSGYVRSLSLSADGRELTTVGPGEVRTWEVDSGRALKRWPIEGPDARLTPDGAAVLDARYPGNVVATDVRNPGKTGALAVKVRDPQTGKILRELKLSGEWLASPDGKSIWSQSENGESLIQVDIDKGIVLQKITNVGPGLPISISADGRLVVTATNSQITGWNTKSGERAFQWSSTEAKLTRTRTDGPPDFMIRFAASPDHRYLAVVVSHPPLPPGTDEPDYTEHLYCCELTTGKILWKQSSNFSRFHSFSFRPDGKVIAVGYQQIRFFDTVKGTQLAELNGQNGPIMTLAFGADGKRLASGGWDGTAMVWDVSQINP